MLQTGYLRENKEGIIQALQKRNFDATELIEKILTLDDNRKSCQQELDQVLAESNQMAKQIGELFKSGKQEEANELKEKNDWA